MKVLPLRIRCRIGAALGSKDAMPLIGISLGMFADSGFRPVT